MINRGKTYNQIFELFWKVIRTGKQKNWLHVMPGKYSMKINISREENL